MGVYQLCDGEESGLGRTAAGRQLVGLAGVTCHFGFAFHRRSTEQFALAFAALRVILPQ